MTDRPPTGPPDTGDAPTYYDRPVLKAPVWIWTVPAYFYTGGVAAGTALIGAVAQVADRDGYAALVRRCRDVAAVGTTVGTGLLVADLGRPERFLHMLRVFRPTSAISVGSWTLAASASAAAAAAALGRLQRRDARVLADAAGLAAGALAPLLGTYTAVLLADTAVPLWRGGRRELPVLFGASAVASATDVLDLLPLGERDHRLSRRLGTAAKVAELAAARALHRRVAAVPAVARPLEDGLSGVLWRTAEAATIASVVVGRLPLPHPSRGYRRLAGAVLGTVGAVASRAAVFLAGRRSAVDPHAVFAQQRSGGTPARAPAS